MIRESENTQRSRTTSRKDITILIKELQELCLLLWAHFSANADELIQYSRVECHSLEITFDFNCLFEFCRHLPL
jgi:hypothetical protein